MNHNDFFTMLKNESMGKVYLLHGEEEYVKAEAFSALCTACVEYQELNLQFYDKSTDVNSDTIISACDMIPFMSKRRVVVCRYLPTEKEAKKLIDYFSVIPDESILIFYIEGKADGKSVIVKALKKINADCEFSLLDDNEIIRWIVQHATADGISLDKQTAAFLIRLVGHNMYDIKNEYEKLRDYVLMGDKIVTKGIVSNIVIKNIEYQIFSTFSSFLAGKFKDGFVVLDSVMEGKDKESESLPIAGYFLSNFKILLTAFDCTQNGMQPADIAKKINRPLFVAKEACVNARKFTRYELLFAIASFSDILAIKTSGGSSYSALVDAIMRSFLKFRVA